ncbi:DUF3857 domain-containing transglutaminase family protein [Aquibium oceanicum]|nr:DUF3857 domain-containing transglutaminase family protein [Aquibium oceanicum]
MRPIIFFLSALYLFVCSPARCDDAASKVSTGPVGDWVEQVEFAELPATRNAALSGGIAMLLEDDQAIIRAGGNDSYARKVFRIVNRTGLESSGRIDISFDPLVDRLVLHWIHIIRDGQVLDRTQITKPYVVGTETEASQGIFRGKATAYYNIIDVRVGDVIDYSLTFETREQVAHDMLYWSFSTRYSSPVGLIHRRVVWPSDSPLQLRNHRTDVSPIVNTASGMTVYEWSIVDPEPVATEESIPDGEYLLPTVEMSSAANWRVIADAFRPYYQLDLTLPERLARDIDDIAKNYPDEGDRMIEAMRYVQDRYRYVSLSLGPGAYVQRRASEVDETGFGDCKDKALLLASILHRLGMKAVVALVNSDGGNQLRSRLPSTGAFDHAVVKATIGDKSYWIDATEFMKGGRASNFVQANFGFGLPLSEGATLEKLPKDDMNTPTRSVVEEYSMPTDQQRYMTLKARSTYERSSADEMRQRLSETGLSSLSDAYLNYYRKVYPRLERTAILFTQDDRDANRIVIEENYSLDAALLEGSDLIEDFPLRADLSPSLPRPFSENRELAVDLGDLRYRRHTVRVTNLKATFGPPEDMDVLRPYFLLKFIFKSSYGELEADWHFRTLMEEVPPAAFSRYVKAVDAANESMTIRYNFGYDQNAETAGQ